MNPNSATLRSTDICALLGASDQSLYRWLSDPYPTFVWSNCNPRGRTYALPEIVARLRERRRGGLYGEDLAALVAHDTAVRAQNGDDGLWLDRDAQDRSGAYYAALCGEEAERAREIMKAIRGAATEARLSGINRLTQITLIQPGIVQFILSGEASELPVTYGGWQSFAKALWAVNPTENIEVAA